MIYQSRMPGKHYCCPVEARWIWPIRFLGYNMALKITKDHFPKRSQFAWFCGGKVFFPHTWTFHFYFVRHLPWLVRKTVSFPFTPGFCSKEIKAIKWREQKQHCVPLCMARNNFFFDCTTFFSARLKCTALYTNKLTLCLWWSQNIYFFGWPVFKVNKIWSNFSKIQFLVI